MRELVYGAWGKPKPVRPSRKKKPSPTPTTAEELLWSIVYDLQAHDNPAGSTDRLEAASGEVNCDGGRWRISVERLLGGRE